VDANELEELGAATEQQYLPLRKVVAVGVGNALEFYDFITFSFFAIQIGHCFFPESQTSHGLLYALATFGVGFLTRPLGGVVIGMYGDRVGRKPAMVLSFSLMGASILGLVLTPSYARIGIAAPIFLVIFRLVQGFALRGEVGPSTANLPASAIVIVITWLLRCPPGSMDDRCGRHNRFARCFTSQGFTRRDHGDHHR
jgi:MHS family citrate/tricarballylate:H+ symporter-like MFS transporter